MDLRLLWCRAEGREGNEQVDGEVSGPRYRVGLSSTKFGTVLATGGKWEGKDQWYMRTHVCNRSSE